LRPIGSAHSGITRLLVVAKGDDPVEPQPDHAGGGPTWLVHRPSGGTSKLAQ
jgi:hypothetical protein